MKIAIITPGFLPVPAIRGGAVETLITKIIEDNEINEKFDIDLFTIYDKELKKYNYKKTNLIVFKQNLFRKIKDFCINKLCKILKLFYISDYKAKKIINIMNDNLDYDYVLIENNMFLYKTIYNKYKGNARFVFHLHNDIGKSDKPIKLCEFIYKTSYKILTVSKYLKNRFEKVNNISNSNKIKVLYNCISCNRFSKIDISKEELLKKYEIGNKDIVFLYCGRIDEGKGVFELVKAFTNICNKYDNAKLLIIGESMFDKKYELKIKKLAQNYKKHIEFLGYIDNKKMVSYYNMADVIVIPTVCEEAFGIVAIESMIMSKPLIVTKSGGLVEIVDESCASIVDKKDIINGLAKEMENYILNNNLIIEKGNNSRKRFFAIEEFDDKKYYYNFYESIL